MPDNTILNPGTGGDTIATDDVTTLNGAASSGVKVQRVKVMYGGNNDATDASLTNPLPVSSRARGQTVWRPNTDKIITSPAVDTAWWSLIAAGSGQTVSQSSGNIVLTSGTTANSETIIRSLSSWSGSLAARMVHLISQRIANNNFIIELVDVIGDGLSYTINSATSVTVTKTAHGFTSANVGQFMNLGAITGAAGIPGRYAIASVPTADTITFTVAAWPATGTGTLSLFAWNYHQVVYTGVSAVNYDTQRRGWSAGASATGTNSGLAQVALAFGVEDNAAYFFDQLAASTRVTNASTTSPASIDGFRYGSIPDDSTSLFLQIRLLNGTTAPASTTTWTINAVSIENYIPQQVSLTNIRPNGLQMPIAAYVLNVPNINTVSTVSAVTNVSAVNSSALANTTVSADVTSAAISTNTTTATITFSPGAEYEVNIPVTVVSGTSPTLDVVVQESDDTGTNWFDVYHFPRITATGMYRSPKIPLKGNRVRYAQTLGGTTPSFTRAINRMAGSWTGAPMLRRIFDRTLATTQALNSTTAAVNTQECRNLQMTISAGAITTTAPALQLQGSNDNGGSWISVGTPLTSVANSTVQTTLVDVNYELVRAIVTTAGSAATLNYVEIKGF